MMIENKKIAFIGAGHITEILLRNLTGRSTIKPENLIVSSRTPAKVQALKHKFNINPAATNEEACRLADLILINVRPENVADILPDLQAATLGDQQIIISLAAGIPMSSLKAACGQAALVRALPNPPSQIGQGVAAIAFYEQLPEDKRKLVRELFASLGEVIEVAEAQLDTITSLSSPVATYLFLQSLIDAGVRQGLSREIATLVAGQTMRGSLALWQNGNGSVADLIAQASTPGGISVETLFSLESDAFKATVMRSIAAGADRAKELGADA